MRLDLDSDSAIGRLPPCAAWGAVPGIACGALAGGGGETRRRSRGGGAARRRSDAAPERSGGGGTRRRRDAATVGRGSGSRNGVSWGSDRSAERPLAGRSGVCPRHRRPRSPLSLENNRALRSNFRRIALDSHYGGPPHLI